MYVPPRSNYIPTAVGISTAPSGNRKTVGVYLVNLKTKLSLPSVLSAIPLITAHYSNDIVVMKAIYDVYTWGNTWFLGPSWVPIITY